MNARLFSVVVLVATLMAPAVAAQSAQTDNAVGTWSGNWKPANGVMDATTVKLERKEDGSLTGKVLAPAQANLTKVTFNARTGVIALEALDPSGKPYKIDGKIDGTRLTGTLTYGSDKGEVNLTKWTFFP